MKKILFACSVLVLFVLTNCNSDAADILFVDIEGTVTNEGSPVKGVLVLLVDDVNITNGLSLSNPGITNSEGDYTILKPKDGDYYVVAIDDVNDNFKYDEGTDRFGFHKNTLGLPKQITVAGEDLDGIDITSLSTGLLN